MVWKNQKIGIGNAKIGKEVISVLRSRVNTEGPLTCQWGLFIKEAMARSPVVINEPRSSAIPLFVLS